MHTFDRAAYEDGRRAYINGASVADVATRMIADWDRCINQSDTDASQPAPDYRAIESASKSFVLGFAQGAIEDIRRAAGGSRQGVKA